MPTVFIAGATGYLGRFLAAEYKAQGWQVRALVRDASRARASGLVADAMIEAEATQAHTLAGTMAGADLVVSALGITRQRDGLTYWNVDYQANANLLAEALNAGVTRFAYIHVLGAEQMRHVPLVAAKQAFADKLIAAPIAHTIIAPSGYFSDMSDFLDMARSGRVWLFGTGQNRINPIDGQDLAQATVELTRAGAEMAHVGGPDVLTHNQIAELAFAALGKPVKITHLPDILRRVALKVLPWITPRHISGPAQFFLTAMGIDMACERYGSIRLKEHFADVAAQTPAKT